MSARFLFANRLHLLLAVAVAGTLAVPTVARTATAWYTVRTGDSLSRIAHHLGVTVAELRHENSLDSDLLQVGQRLRLGTPLRRLRGGDIRWQAPYSGKARATLRAFGDQPRAHGVRVPHTGIDVDVPRGTRVLAPAHGVIRYCGEQAGFGIVVIIDHGADFSTVLAPVEPDSARCRAGEAVLRGDVLGVTGAPTEGPQPYLHVELRQGRQAIPPRRLIR